MDTSFLILIVDDNPEVRDVLELMLDHEGYSTETAATADEALSINAAGRVALFIIDMHMPGKSGLELLKDLNVREGPYEAIIITGSAESENFKQAQEYGVFGYIHKPFTHKILIDYVGRALASVARKREKRAQAGLANTTVH
jgi:two-component system, LuxR family, response regulator FixJ